MESPESAQPKLEMQAGSYSAAALMSWPAARNALVGEAEAVTVGETDGAAAGEAEAGDAGAEGEPAVAAALLAGLEAGAAAELVAELQAVSSRATPASSAPAAIGLPLRAFVVNINSPPFRFLTTRRAASPIRRLACRRGWKQRDQDPFPAPGGQRTERTLANRSTGPRPGRSAPR